MSIELIDVLDKNGNPTGEQKTKLQILDDGDWRKVIHVWVINSHNELIVQQRASKGLWDNLWDVSVGGGVSAGEDPEKTAVRELDEELGIKAEESELQPLGRWDTSKPLPERHVMAHEFSYSFLLRQNIVLSSLTPEPREVVQVKLLPLSSLKEKITDDTEYGRWVPHPREYYLGVIATIKELEK